MFLQKCISSFWVRQFIKKRCVEFFFGLPVFLATTVAQFETLQFSAKQVNALMVTIVYHLSRQVLHFSLEVRIEAPP